MTMIPAGHPAQAAPALMTKFLNSRVRFAPEPEGTPTTAPVAPPAAVVTPPVTPPATPPAASATPPAGASTTPATPATPTSGAPVTALTPTTPDAPKEPVAAYADNWRESYAKGDDKLLKRLQRYASPTAAFDALIAAQNRISSGELQTKLPENATKEEVSAWRKENGIPETPAEYIAKLPNGMTIAEGDRPLVDAFLAGMHKKNASPDVVHEAISWYYANQAAVAEQRQTADASARKTTEDALHAEWNQDYRRNVSAITGLLDQAPAGVKDQIMGARLADGTPLGSNTDALSWLHGLAREINPAATVVPGNGQAAVSAIADEIGSWRAKMADKHSDYWTGPNSEKNQARYRELLTTQSKLEARNQAGRAA